MASGDIGWFRRLVAAIGAWIIYRLIWIFGRTHRRADIPWLLGPTGGPVIGAAAYEEVATAEGLSIERHARHGGLVPDFHQLDGEGFAAAEVHASIRDFYEHTAEFAMDVWSRTYFPANLALALLVTTISRQVNQLNFPLSPLETARGMTSEIISLRTPDGAVKYTGWFRTLASDERRAIYTGFYMTERVPAEPAPCVKVVFPMPNGNATVILRPQLRGGALELDSSGGRFGGAGFYRVQIRDADRVRVWRIRTLKEHFRVFVDDRGALRCDHSVRFLGLPVLRLHYKMFRSSTDPGSPHMLRGMTSRVVALVVLLAAATASAQPGPDTVPRGAPLGSPPQPTQFMPAPPHAESPMIELVTMGIGSLIWERHGHIALCVTARGLRSSLVEPQPEDRCYNYGIGDFHEPIKMTWGFFRGAHSFWVGKDLPQNMLEIYRYFDRTIWVQPLPLDDAQKQQVIAKLESDIKEENRYYAYDHFADNCTTRIRDIIDNVTDHALKKMTESPGDKTFRDYARDGFYGMRVPLIITDIAMGRSTDRVPSYWERMFLPQYLREAVQAKWGIKPYIVYERKACRAEERTAAMEHREPDASCVARGIPSVPDPKSGREIFALIILVLTAPVWATRLWGRFQRTGLAISIIPYWLLGTVLTFLAIISPLPYVRLNETPLVWFPLDLAILFLSPARKVLYAKGRVAMLGLIALLMLVGVLHQPLWAPLLWPLVPMATVAFWKRPA